MCRIFYLSLQSKKNSVMKKYILRFVSSLLIVVVLFVVYKVAVRVYNYSVVRTHKFENGTYVGRMSKT